VYHTLYNPSKEAGRCDVCRGELYQRPDDQIETVGNRLKVYFNQTMPLIDFYRQKGLLHEADGEKDIEEVQSTLLSVIRSTDRRGQ